MSLGSMSVPVRSVKEFIALAKARPGEINYASSGPGGSGQYGNAINAFRAGNVTVRGNRIRNCDYSAVRGNSASNIQITGNSVSDVREVALYSEFSFEGAVIANNTVDGAALGVSVCNFNEGGRIAVVQGNIIRNLLPKRPIGTAPDDDAGIGIYVEADTSVSGNVIENAPAFGIIAGWGKYLRDVVITGNVIRNAFVGVGVSVMPGAGTALVAFGGAGGLVGATEAKRRASRPRVICGVCFEQLESRRDVTHLQHLITDHLDSSP